MFKKYSRSIIAVILTAVIVAILFSHNTFAVTCGGVETSLIECEEGGDGGIYHLLALVIDFFGIGVGILGVIGISWAGVEYLTAGGSEERTVRAKRRIYDIVLGLVCYVVIMSVTQWLLPGGVLNPSNDNSGVETISINYSGSPEVGSSFVPTVTINDDAKDKTYSLISDDDSVAVAFSRSVKCVDEGTTDIFAIAANGTEDSFEVTCVPPPDPSNPSSDSTPTGTSNGTETVGSMMDTNFNRNKGKLRQETKSIIQDHRKDFYSSGKKSYKKVVLGEDSKYGSYKNYVKSLGGVFTQFANKNRIPVQTAADLQAAAEYVWGLLMIWGEDYRAGNYFYEWGLGTDDGFYASESTSTRQARPYGKTSSINTFLKKSSSASINTNCHKTIDIFRKSTTLKNIKGGVGNGNDSGHISMSKAGKITKISKLRVGDLITFHKGDIGHTALVGEVYKNKVVLYDGGSRFQKKRKYKFVIERRNDGIFKGEGDFGFYSSWFGWRPWDIDQSVTMKGIN